MKAHSDRSQQTSTPHTRGDSGQRDHLLSLGLLLVLTTFSQVHAFPKALGGHGEVFLTEGIARRGGVLPVPQAMRVSVRKTEELTLTEGRVDVCFHFYYSHSESRTPWPSEDIPSWI